MKCFIHLGCYPHPQFCNAPISQQAMGCVLGLEACRTHVPNPCSGHRLSLEICYLLLFLVFPLFWPEAHTMHFLLSLCEQSPAMAFHPLCESPKASSDTEQQEFLHPQSWHWFLRHMAAQRTQPAIVLNTPFPAPKPKVSKLISLAAPLCVSAWTPLHLPYPSLKQQHKAPTQRSRVKNIPI